MKEVDIKELEGSKVEEESKEIKLDVIEADPQEAYLELPEELTTKTIKYIEKIVRKSYEYRNYIKYLKEELDLTRCSLLKEIDINECKVSLEFHHCPLTLYDIVQVVGNQMIGNLASGERVSCLEIADHVVAEHYKNRVGLIPLTKTMHEKAHDRSIFIPMKSIHGNYKEFKALYKDYIDSDMLDKIMFYEENDDTEQAKTYNEEQLKKVITKYDITYYKNEEKEDSDEEAL